MKGLSMKKYCKALANIAIALIIFLLIIMVAPRVLIFFSPFVAGWIIALIASPMVRFFEEKLKIKRKAGSAFVIIAVIALVVLLLYLVGAKLVEEIIGLISALPEMWAAVESDFSDISRNLNVFYKRLPQNVQSGITDLAEEIAGLMGETLSKVSTPTINAVGNFAKSLPTIIIGVIMALLASYFFVAEKKTVAEWLRKNMPSSIQIRYQMIKKSLVMAVGGYLKAQLKIEVWMYLLLVIGLSILKIDYALLIALGIAFLDFFPFFGTGTVMVPWAIIKILSGDYSMAIGLLIIWGGGQLARQLIQPKIVGDSVGVPPIPTLFLLYIGYKVGGVFGMIAAVPIGLIIITMYTEGAFETTKNSVLILVSGINKFRRLEKEDMVNVEAMREQELERTRQLNEQAEEQRAKKERKQSKQ
ncbi:MAG: sporulation integral membrane protein YtvI [Lachnospiraceae bacterium]|nr:sporulation integral membrane protein YtvI [Lachnospiraceae bacterium]